MKLRINIAGKTVLVKAELADQFIEGLNDLCSREGVCQDSYGQEKPWVNLKLEFHVACE